MTDRDSNPTPPATAAATFHATRRELVGDRPLLGSAEIARASCAGADRFATVVAITPGRIRRVDCWFAGVGFVTHAAAPDPDHAPLGAVCDRARAAEMIGSLVESLVGGLPPTPADAPVELGSVGELAPDTIPGGIDWVAVVSARNSAPGSTVERVVIAECSAGLAVARLDSLADGTVAEPASHADLGRRLDELAGSTPRSVVELLDDRPR